MANPTPAELSKAFPKIGEKDARELSKAMNEAVHPLDAKDGETSTDDVLEFANELLGGHGIEAIEPVGAFVDKYYRNVALLYVNMGDAYDTTILLDTEAEEFSIGSWEDWLEAVESEQEEEEAEEIE